MVRPLLAQNRELNYVKYSDIIYIYIYITRLVSFYFPRPLMAVFIISYCETGVCSVTKQLARTCQASRSLTVSNWVLKTLGKHSTRNLVTESSLSIQLCIKIMCWGILFQINCTPEMLHWFFCADDHVADDNILIHCQKCVWLDCGTMADFEDLSLSSKSLDRNPLCLSWDEFECNIHQHNPFFPTNHVKY